MQSFGNKDKDIAIIIPAKKIWRYLLLKALHPDKYFTFEWKGFYTTSQSN
jgi:hypothetical protein